MRGRRPKPTALKAIEGNPGKRPLPENEPKFSTRTTCPTFLDDDAKSCWRRLYPKLLQSGVLKAVDRDVLAAYCSAYSTWKKADEFLKKQKSQVYKTASKVLKPWPQIAIRNAALDRMATYGAKLGIGPADRVRLAGIGKNEEEDPLKRLLEKRRKMKVV